MPDLAFNAVIELVLNKYSCSMLKRIRELVGIASLTSGYPRQNSSARLFFFFFFGGEDYLDF